MLPDSLKPCSSRLQSTLRSTRRPTAAATNLQHPCPRGLGDKEGSKGSGDKWTVWLRWKEARQGGREGGREGGSKGGEGGRERGERVGVHSIALQFICFSGLSEVTLAHSRIHALVHTRTRTRTRTRACKYASMHARTDAQAGTRAHIPTRSSRHFLACRSRRGRRRPARRAGGGQDGVCIRCLHARVCVCVCVPARRLLVEQPARTKKTRRPGGGEAVVCMRTALRQLCACVCIRTRSLPPPPPELPPASPTHFWVDASLHAAHVEEREGATERLCCGSEKHVRRRGDAAEQRRGGTEDEDERRREGAHRCGGGARSGGGGTMRGGSGSCT